ncbi:MAG: monovalent cation:proton antiporter-2 (CPA2) family protein, partial [Alphaproteobacteria bacterium]
MPESGPLEDALIVLAAAILFVPLFRRFRISPVVGYLVAGVAIGPHGLGLMHGSAGTRFLAEFGVVFLLFSIGLELPFRRLVAMRRHIFGLGLAQVALTSLVIGLVAVALGRGAPEALVLGGALALSSTATVLLMLVERGEVTVRFGRITVAVLLFQDLAVVPLLALLPLLAGDGADVVRALALAGARAALALAGIVLIGRFVVRPIYRLVAGARSPELFAATSLFVVLGTGWATAQAGMSMALGAFLAGLLLAESEYRHQIEADIQPFRGLFLGFFFMTVGMTIGLARLADQALVIAALTIALVVGKAALLIGLCRLFGLGAAVAVRVGLLLGQGGEFAFVVLGLATDRGIVDRGTGQTLLVAVAISMAVTPLLAVAGKRWSEHLERRGAGAAELVEEADDLAGHVVIAGFGRVGQTVASLLAANRVPYLALDLDADRVAQGRAQGLPVFFGDASKPNVLRAAGAARARAVAVTLD